MGSTRSILVLNVSIGKPLTQTRLVAWMVGITEQTTPPIHWPILVLSTKLRVWESARSHGQFSLVSVCSGLLAELDAAYRTHGPTCVGLPNSPVQALWDQQVRPSLSRFGGR
jgi:hypothetical protein